MLLIVHQCFLMMLSRKIIVRNATLHTTNKFLIVNYAEGSGRVTASTYIKLSSLFLLLIEIKRKNVYCKIFGHRPIRFFHFCSPEVHYIKSWIKVFCHGIWHYFPSCRKVLNESDIWASPWMTHWMREQINLTVNPWKCQ